MFDRTSALDITLAGVFFWFLKPGNSVSEENQDLEKKF